MRRIPVRKGTRVAIGRHAISNWNEDAISALLENRERPPRFPGKRNAPISAMGHLQTFFLAKFLARRYSPKLFKRKGVIANSLHLRSKETARGIMKHGGFVTTNIYQSDLLAERHHTRYAFVHDMDATLAEAEEYGLVKASAFDRGNAQLVGTDVTDMRDLLRVHPRLGTMLMSNQDMHAAVACLLTSFNDSLEFYYNQEKARIGPGRDAEIRSAARSKALLDFGSRLAPEFSNWFFEQEALEPNQRRKTPTGESFAELSYRANEFLSDFIPALEQLGNDATAIVVTHSYLLLALRQLIEGFSTQELDEMISAEGLPFPPHVGMTFYREKDGYLELDGKPNQIPPEFESVGRRLRFKEETPQRVIDEACKLLGVEEYRKTRNRRKSGARSHSDYRFRFIIPEEDQRSGPGLSRSNPKKNVSEKKAS